MRGWLIVSVLVCGAQVAQAEALSVEPERRMCLVTHTEPARCVYHAGYHFAGPWYDMGDEWHRVWYWQPPWTEHIPARTVRRLEPCRRLHILDDSSTDTRSSTSDNPVEQKPHAARRKR